MVCCVATNEEVPTIWSDVDTAPNKQEILANLVQYLMSCILVCCRDFMGHADLLYASITLYNFFAGDRFVNPGENPDCPTGGISMWTSLQRQDDVGLQMATLDVYMAALDRRNAAADQITCATRVQFQPLHDAGSLQ